MQVIVDVPALVGQPQVVVRVPHGVVEDQEVGQQDLVHAPPGLEHMEVVLPALALDVARLARQRRAQRVDVLTARLEHACDRVLGQPVDLELRDEPAQRVGDRHVALRVAEADRTGHEQGALLLPAHRTAPGALYRLGLAQEFVQQEIDAHRIAALGGMSAALESHKARAWDGRVQGIGVCRSDNRVLRAVDDQRRAADGRRELGRPGRGALVDGRR